jgi:hypothetical protein
VPSGGCATTVAGPITRSAQTVEPVIGQVKICLQMTRMSRRGFTACRANG